MTKSTLKAILENHHIEYVVQDGQIFALEIYTRDAKTYAEWVLITYSNIMAWLGY